MKRLLIAAMALLVTVSTNAEEFTNDKKEIKYKIEVDKPVDIKMEFSHQYLGLTGTFFKAKLVDENGIVLLNSDIRADKKKEVRHVPVKKGSYLLTLTGEYSKRNKKFDFVMTHVSGYFEKEYNDKRKFATPLIYNTLYSGYIQRYVDKDWYKLEIKEPSRCEIVFKHENLESPYSFGFHLENEDGVNLLRTENKGTRREERWSIGLPKGNYFLRLGNIGSITLAHKEYKIGVVVTPDSSFELEPNDKMKSAQQLTATNKLTGVIQRRSIFDKDYYKFDLLKEGTVSINFNHENFETSYNFDIVVLNADSEEVGRRFVSKGSKTKTTKKLTLKPGTYFVRIKSDFQLWGKQYVIYARLPKKGGATTTAEKKTSLEGTQKVVSKSRVKSDVSKAISKKSSVLELAPVLKSSYSKDELNLLIKLLNSKQ